MLPRSIQDSLTRRCFFRHGASGLGAMALASLMQSEEARGEAIVSHFAPRAKQVIYIFQAGGPAQMELWDYKPGLAKWHGKELPPSIRKGGRLTGFTAGQGKYPVIASPFQFKKHGQSGQWLSELWPHLAKRVDDLCVIRSMTTEAINHDPAVTYLLTGAQQPGRPSLGSWLSYGLGSENRNIPAFVVLLTQGAIQDASTPLSSRHWGNGFLPAHHQGVKFRSGADPVLYLSNPPGVRAQDRRRMLDVTAALNRIQKESVGDPEIEARIAQYELAYRMQTSVPDIVDLSSEPEHVLKAYGPQARAPGSYAASCLLARRLVELGARFVQIFDRDWDHHRNAPQHLRTKAKMTDQPTAALLGDLKQRGLLEETLVICGGEFGRTVFCQGPVQKRYGRDHHGRCFAIWMAGGGIKPGMAYGETDDFSFNVAKDPVPVHDLNATILHCLGMDHTKLTFQYQGRHHRLTDVHGHVIQDILA